MTPAAWISPQAYRGTYFGVHSLGEVGNFLGPWTGELILVHFGGAAMFLYFALVAAAAIPAFWLTRLEEERTAKYSSQGLTPSRNLGADL